MGFFDSLMKAAKLVEKVVDEVNNQGGNNQGGNNQGGNSQGGNSQVGNNHSTSGYRYGSITPARIIEAADDPIAPYTEAKDFFYDGDYMYNVYYEIPEDFIEFDSHAEPEMCYTYKHYDNDEGIDTNQPIICITPEDYVYTAVECFLKTGSVKNMIFYEPVNIGNFLFKAKCEYYGKMYAYFYGFQRGESKSYTGLSLTYGKDLEGTDFEKKLMEILDHAAMTYREEKEN